MAKTAVTAEGPKLKSELDEGGKFFNKTPHPDPDVEPELFPAVKELAGKVAERFVKKQKASAG